MPIVIEDFIVETPPPETAASHIARTEAGVASALPAPAWTAGFAHRIAAELTLAAERAERLQAD